MDFNLENKKNLLEALEIIKTCGQLQVIIVNAGSLTKLEGFEVELKQEIRRLNKKLKLLNLTIKETGIDYETKCFLSFARSRFDVIDPDKKQLKSVQSNKQSIKNNNDKLMPDEH